MQNENHIWNLAEAYLNGTLTPVQQQELQQRLEADAAYAASFQEYINIISSLQGSGRQKRFATLLKDIRQQHTATDAPATHKVRSIPLRSHYLRTAAIAAGIALFTSLTTFWMVRHSEKRVASQYSALRRDMANINRSNQIIQQKINDNTRALTPTAEVRFTGTGFAVTNDGYLVTNYHVTEGADSIYIQNSDGDYYKAFVVSFDQQADIALLKVEDNGFRFGKGEVPYAFAKGKQGLGSKVFTLGYPQDDIVYSEGYISARNGYQGDSMQYRLELPASYGQSGAPVLDEKGNVIAMVTAKGSSEGNTYAVSSKAVLELLQTLPKAAAVNLPKTNRLGGMSRSQQIQKLQDYTCAVKVYKK